ncbi:MAG: hypothetical protein U0441_06595 [Polyangiaceae bacterium]
MGNTLADEPLPPTQSQPPDGDRPTLDDVPPAAQPPRRGASPTLVDQPVGARRGASPTLPDMPPPHTYPTPPQAPLHAAPPPATAAMRAMPTPPAAPLHAGPPMAVTQPVAPLHAAPAQMAVTQPVPVHPAAVQAVAPQPMAPAAMGFGRPPTAFATTPDAPAAPPKALPAVPNVSGGAPNPISAVPKVFGGPPNPISAAQSAFGGPPNPISAVEKPFGGSPNASGSAEKPFGGPQAPSAPVASPMVPILAGAAASPPSEVRIPPGPPTPPPPPVAYPAPAQSAGLLAQIPAMPGQRAQVVAPPHLFGAPTPVSDTTPDAHDPHEEAAREALPPPPAAAAPAAAAPLVTPAAAALAAAEPGAAATAAAGQNTTSSVGGPMPGATPVLAPGARTLLGVAPATPPHAGPHVPGAQGGNAQGTNPQGANSQGPNPQGGNSQSASQQGPNPQGVNSQDASPAGQPSSADASESEPAEAGEPQANEMRPTVTDAAPPGRARKWIAAVLAVIGVLAIAGVVIGYLFLVRYTPLARRHIPAASNVAIRVDARQIGTFAPVRKYLWPLLVDRPSQKAGKTFADRVSEDTGINPTLDIREMIVASMDSKSWVLLVGGNFKPGKFVPGMEKVFQEEGIQGWHRNAEMLVGPTGIAMAQADDGTLVLGTEAEIVTASLPASEEYKRMDLPETGALGFAMSKEAFEELSRETGAFDPSGAMRRIRHMKGTFTLGDDPQIDIDIEPKGGEKPETLGQDVESFLGKLRLGLVLFPDRFGEKTALSSAKVAVENEHVRVRGPWPLEGLDRGCEKLVTLLGLAQPR